MASTALGVVNNNNNDSRNSSNDGTAMTRDEGGMDVDDDVDVDVDAHDAGRDDENKKRQEEQQSELEPAAGGEPAGGAADMTMVMDDEVDDVINEQDGEEFNFASALALRKNLTAAFDKHAAGGGGGCKDGGGGRKDGAGTGSKGLGGGGGVRSKIAKLEKAASSSNNKSGGKRGAQGHPARPRFGVKAGPKGGIAKGGGGGGGVGDNGIGGGGGGGGSKASRPRPPKVPSQTNRKGRAAAAKKNKEGGGGGAKLSVYLRIRPPVAAPNAASASASASASEPSADAAASNTIEIMPPRTEEKKMKKAKDKKGGVGGTCSTATTTIRTYPPQDSNAAKAVRSHHPRPSSDVIFGKTYSNGNGGGTASSSAAADEQQSGTGRGRGVKEYEFTNVFGPDSAQADVYGGVAAPLVRGLFPPSSRSGDGDADGSSKDGSTAAAATAAKAPLVGQSALLFAYGITNAGKTHTIMGNGGSGEKTKEKGAAAAPAAVPAAAETDELNPNRGIIPRALHDILGRMNEQTNNGGDSGGITYTLSMSYFEIYNEQVFDLIGKGAKSNGDGNNAGNAAASRSKPLLGASSASALAGPVPLKLRESRDGKIFVKGLTRHRVTTVGQGLDLARLAMAKRHTSSNNINSDSSRSHSICQLELVAHPPAVATQSAGDDDDLTETGSVASSGYNTEDEAASLKKKENRSVSMWIVDLAGSERSKRTGTVTKSTRQKEAALINSSLMKLMRCLQTLRDNQRPEVNGGGGPGASSSSSGAMAMVPFRESKLTHLFMNHLTGASASRTSMIVNANPSAADYDETQHVLSYATVARSIVISEDDYDRKRRAIALTSGEHTHDDNGRPISRLRNCGGGGREKSPPRKIARLASKLSPRSMLAKRREQQSDAQKRKVQLQNNRDDSSRALPVKAGVGGNGPMKKLLKPSGGTTSKEMEEKDTKISDQQKEIERLQSSLVESREETASARSDVLQLKEDLSQREAEIRMELAEEMEGQMKAMRQHYTTVVDRLKQQLHSQPTPGKSTRKAKLDKAEAVIEELMDQIEECEEDIARQRAIHEEEIERLTKLHTEALSAKDREIVELRELLEDDVTVSSSGSPLLEENRSPAPHMVKRLPGRQRPSEVACSSSPQPTQPQSSSKKKLGFRAKIASPGKRKQENRQPLSPAPRAANGNEDVSGNDENIY